MKKFFVIAAMVCSSIVVANANTVSNDMMAGDQNAFVAASNQNGPSIYGTWKSKVDFGTESITIVISQNGMTITKVEPGEKKIEFYNNIRYDAKKNRIKAHQYKEIEVENTVQNVKHESDTEVFYVKWIDGNHIQLGDHPYEMDSDYGTLVRQ